MTPLETLAQLGPVATGLAATGLAATVALVVGVATVWQRDLADQREQWWKRAQWVFDQTWPDDREDVDRQYVLLSYLAASDLAGEGRAGHAGSVREIAVEIRWPRRRDWPGHHHRGAGEGRPMTSSRIPADRRRYEVPENPAVRRSWARWQYARNERLGLDTPQWIIDLAELESDPLLLAILAKGRWRHPRGLLGRWGDRRWRLLPRRRPRVGTGTVHGLDRRRTAR